MMSRGIAIPPLRHGGMIRKPSVSARMLFGYDDSRNDRTPISTDRDFVLIAGSHETLVRAALESIHVGEQMIFVDLDGRYVDEILGHISRPRRGDVFLFELDWERPPAFNT